MLLGGDDDDDIEELAPPPASAGSPTAANLAVAIGPSAAPSPPSGGVQRDRRLIRGLRRMPIPAAGADNGDDDDNYPPASTTDPPAAKSPAGTSSPMEQGRSSQAAEPEHGAAKRRHQELLDVVRWFLFSLCSLFAPDSSSADKALAGQACQDDRGGARYNECWYYTMHFYSLLALFNYDSTSWVLTYRRAKAGEIR
jgi:hypothetical protein